MIREKPLPASRGCAAAWGSSGRASCAVGAGPSHVMELQLPGVMQGLTLTRNELSEHPLWQPRRSSRVPVSESEPEEGAWLPSALLPSHKLPHFCRKSLPKTTAKLYTGVLGLSFPFQYINHKASQCVSPGSERGYGLNSAVPYNKTAQPILNAGLVAVFFPLLGKRAG